MRWGTSLGRTGRWDLSGCEAWESGADKESHWLPAPDGRFFRIFRTDPPADDIVGQTRQPPKITNVGG